MWFPLTKIDEWFLTVSALDNEAEFTSLLGRVLDYWSYLEGELRVSMMHLLECDSTAADVLFYSIVSNSTRIDIIQTLARRLMPDGPEKDGFLLLVSRCRDLNKARNDIVHAEYHGGGPIERVLVKPRSSKGPIRQYHPYTSRELETHIEAVNLLSIQFSFANEEEPRDVMPRRPKQR